MMNSSRSHHSRPESGNAAKINDGCDLAGSSSKSKNARLLAHRAKSKRLCEELTRQVAAILPESNGINPANGMFSRHRLSRPPWARFGARMRDELAHESVAILESDDALAFKA